ncbi:alpha/beta fold hydrolase [Alicyclobacillus tolerans]|uniref:Pimeloyl-ACP methyl ester carboxylesterase n=2 Tax=Alicyclobacillus tolerans TaxID=90970 RepID=A0A1M6UNP3_9BACL|nr:alpha/beta hydrolase [Alicyclobacillus montanus]SHK70769.1 Pimeloyl-ACP methyl ester carboxylesterase [Alicyclobacillus montanus]
MSKIYLIHGLMGTSILHFKNQIQAWCVSHEVIALDLPGHGKNQFEAQDPFFQSALGWVSEQIQMQGKGHIVGLSLGASVAIHLALRIPKLCESIVLTGYAPAIPTHMTGIMKEQYEAFLNIEENNPEVAREFMRLHGENWYQTLKAVLKDFTFNYPTVTFEQIQKLNVPTLVLNGSNEKHERDAVFEMANSNKIIQAGLIPGAGHTANMERPEIYNLVVQTFWDNMNSIDSVQPN